MEQSAIEGVSRLYEWGGIVTLLVLIVIALGWFCWYLVKRNERLANKFIEVVERNTAAAVALKEEIRNARNR